MHPLQIRINISFSLDLNTGLGQNTLMCIKGAPRFVSADCSCFMPYANTKPSNQGCFRQRYASSTTHILTSQTPTFKQQNHILQPRRIVLDSPPSNGPNIQSDRPRSATSKDPSRFTSFQRTQSIFKRQTTFLQPRRIRRDAPPSNGPQDWYYNYLKLGLNLDLNKAPNWCALVWLVGGNGSAQA